MSDDEPNDLDWVQLRKEMGAQVYNESAQEKFNRKFQENPFVPIGNENNLLPLKTKVMLVQALVLLIIDYGDVCYLDLNADLLNTLDRFLNNCIGFIFNLSCLATVGALSYGLWSFRAGRMKLSQQMMRWRIAAQGFTITAIVVGVMMTTGKNFQLGDK